MMDNEIKKMVHFYAMVGFEDGLDTMGCEILYAWAMQGIENRKKTLIDDISEMVEEHSEDNEYEANTESIAMRTLSSSLINVLMAEKKIKAWKKEEDTRYV